MNEQQMSRYTASKGVPAPDLAVQGSGALLLGGALSVLAGVKPRQGLAALVAFLVPVTLQMHRFWEIEDEQQRMNELINFTKNFALVGAALMMMEIPEPWPASVESARREEELYVRLGNRDWAMLPA
jgi:uncharacterized membrane protein YphA (DoxX/SURF4 family)